MGSCLSKTPATAEEQQYICKKLADEMLGLCLTDVMSKLTSGTSPGNEITVPAVPKALCKIKEASAAFKEAADAEEAKAKAAGEEKLAEEKPAEVGAEEGGGGGGDGLVGLGMGMAKGLFGKAKDMGEELLGKASDMTHYALAKILRGAAEEMDKVHETFERKSTMEAIGKKIAYNHKEKIEQAFRSLIPCDMPDALAVCTEKRKGDTISEHRITDAVLHEPVCKALVDVLKQHDDLQKEIKDELLGKDSTTEQLWDATQADYKRIVTMIQSLQMTGLPDFVRVPTLDSIDVPEHVCSGIVQSLVRLLGEREAEIRKQPLNKGEYPDIFDKVFRQETGPIPVKDQLLKNDYKVMGGLQEK